jgi:hypothetical protein
MAIQRAIRKAGGRCLTASGKRAWIAAMKSLSDAEREAQWERERRALEAAPAIEPSYSVALPPKPFVVVRRRRVRSASPK